MSIINKCKKMLISIVVALISAINKVYARVTTKVSPAYGIEQPKSVSYSTFFLDILKYATIPVIALIGVIIYLKKGKENIKFKLLISIIVIGIVAILDMIVYMLFNDML